MKKIFSRISKTAMISFCVAIVSIIVGLGINIVYAAWTAPIGTPPAGTIAAPINTSAADQYKVGSLRLGSAASPSPYKLYVEGDTFSQGNIVPDTAGNYSLGSGTYLASDTWSQLWLKSDTANFTNGIHFDNSPIDTGINYNKTDHRFNFIKGGTIAYIGSDGTFYSDGDINAMKGMNIDSNTLTVDATNNRVGVGTASPTYALDVENGDASISNGRVIIGSGTFPNNNSTLYVGTSGTPVSTLGAIEAYSNGSLSTIYGYYTGGSAGKAGVEGVSVSGYGVKGTTSSVSKAGVAGFNDGYSFNNSEDIAPGVIGKNTVDFGADTYDHAQSAGVLGESSGTDLSQGYVDTYGVYAKAGTASANSPAESIKTYGLFAIEGTEINGGVSYAGYFSGDVHVTGDLTTSYGSNVGIGTTSLTDALRVRGNLRVDNENTSTAYLQIDSTTAAPAAADCDVADEVGRMVLDATGNKLYVCDDTGWKSVAI
ncbi:MAG: hypothetical protein WCW66_03775 [Patescibacteria group bacterium]